MKRAATHLFKTQSKNRAFFFKIIELLLCLRPPPPGKPWADPRAIQRSENRTPGVTRMCESPGVARGEMVRCTFQIFWGAGSEDFACATLPTTPLIFKAKFKI